MATGQTAPVQVYPRQLAPGYLSLPDKWPPDKCILDNWHQDMCWCTIIYQSNICSGPSIISVAPNIVYLYLPIHMALIYLMRPWTSTNVENFKTSSANCISKIFRKGPHPAYLCKICVKYPSILKRPTDFGLFEWAHDTPQVGIVKLHSDLTRPTWGVS